VNVKNVVLGDIADICLGKMLDQAKNKGEYQPYLANVNVRWGGFDLENLPKMRFQESEEERYGLRYGDILVCEGGEPGRCAIWKDQIPDIKFQKALHRVRVHEKDADYRWLFYRFLYAKSRGEFDQYFSGTTTIKHMPGEKIVKIKLALPNLKIQKRIGDILSSYDDLIENNRKQSKLLEEAAQRLYKEWFVDLRFPGYEDTPIHDGIPDGWMIGELGTIAIDAGKNEKKENANQYSCYLPIDCLPRESLTYTDKNDISLAESSLVGFKQNDILFGAMRPYFHKVVVARDKGLTRSTCFVVNAKEEDCWAYLLMLLFSKDTVDYATKISVGTTMPYVRWKDFVQMPAIIPAKSICLQFQNYITPIVNRISCLASSIEKLIQSRDRLLPKLMTGEMEV